MVYDVSGRAVATLVYDYLPAGVHYASFDGSTLSSGVYFAVIQANDFRKVNKMLLVK